MIEAIVFDFDGVLVESLEIKTKAFVEIFSDDGEETARKIVQYHLQHLSVSRFEKLAHISNVILGRPLDGEALNRLAERFSELVENAVVNAAYVAGAAEFLERERAAYRFFIASATPVRELLEVVNRRGMAGWFHGVHGSPETKEDVLRRVVREHGSRPEAVLFVGDGLSDYRAASACGTPFIARVHEHNREQFSNMNGPKIADLHELGEAIRSLSGIGHA